MVGNKTNFERSNVNLRLKEKVAPWAGLKGQMIITKVDETSAEGTFYFTASKYETKKTFEVTDGSFRILYSKK